VSSLELSEQVLRALGDAPERARHSIERFREFDERLLVQEVALHQDEGRLIQNAIDARRELAFLFASDQVDAQLASREENP
jgi:glutathione-regulated potassium-efflux system protein KefB